MAEALIALVTLAVGVGVGWALGRTAPQPPPRVMDAETERDGRREEARALTKRLYEVDPSLDRIAYLDATPASFENEFAAFQSLIDRDPASAERQTVYGRRDLDLETIGELHESAAQTLWSSSDAADGFRCAFHYRLAAHCQLRLEDKARAGWLLHFAGHRFRALRSMEKAARAYVASAEAFAELPSSDEAVAAKMRSARRAVALYTEVGEVGKASEVAERFLES